MKPLKNFLKGIAVGVATLVPGVSGGTMAIILGIYDGLIHAISSFFEDWKKHSILLLEIGLGGVLGLGLFSRLIEQAMNTYPYVMRFLFMGVIIGGLPVLYRKSTSSGKKHMTDYLFLLIGFVIVLLMSIEPKAVTTLATSFGIWSFIFLFIAGIILAIALVLPGISGSFMLLALGLYDVTISAINSRDIPFLIPLGLGVIAGTLGTTKAIEKFLQKYPVKTYMLIIGLVIGSLISILREDLPVGVQPSGLEFVYSAVVFVIGFITIFWLGKRGLTD